MQSKKMIVMSALAAVLLSGCSFSNPFGIGYDTSVSETKKSKTFGISGSPKDIYKYREKIRKVQDDYMKSGIDEELYFGISHDGDILVKHDREAEFENYEMSDWKDEIDEGVKEKEKELEKIRKKREERAAKETKKSGGSIATKSADFTSQYNDLTVTKENDLSIIYQEQTPMVSSRTKVGNIIRDNGKIQQVFVANYVNNDGDLVASHDLYVVVREPSWVVGEETPKNSGSIGEIPTPISKAMVERQNYTSKQEDKVINSYNNNDPAAVTNSINTKSDEELRDQEIIKNFLKETTKKDKK